MVLGQLLFEPEVVMLLRPVEIDLAGRHGLERALHSERTDVDMTNDHRNEQDGDNGVYDLRDLHPRDVRHVERNSRYPEIVTVAPAPRANQNTNFSPALKRPAGACFDLMKPPPCLIQSMSTFCGILSFIQSAAISTRPMTNETLTKLWVYLAICDSLLNASGPITGNNNSLPNVMFKPVKPRTTKDIAVSQC